MPANPPRRFPWKKALLVLVALVLLVEGTLRLAGWWYTRSYWKQVERDLAGHEAVRVLAIGESTTVGLWVSREESYPGQLERLLRTHYRREDVEVFVPPHIGQNTAQVSHRMERYLASIRPQLVIFMCGANDGWSLAESSVPAHVPWSEPGAWEFKLRAYADRLRVVKLVKFLASGLSDGASRLRGYLQGEPELAHFPPRENLTPLFPREIVQAWRAEMRSMIRASQASGAAVVLMTYPMYTWPPVADIEQLAREEGVPLVRNDLTFAEIVSRGVARDYLFSEGYHPTAPGYALVARNLFETLGTAGLLAKLTAPVRSRP